MTTTASLTVLKSNSPAYIVSHVPQINVKLIIKAHSGGVFADAAHRRCFAGFVNSIENPLKAQIENAEGFYLKNAPQSRPDLLPNCQFPFTPAACFFHPDRVSRNSNYATNNFFQF